MSDGIGRTSNSPGMKESIARYEKMGLPIERQKLDWEIVKEIIEA